MRTANGGHVRSPRRDDFILIPRFDPLAFAGRVVTSAPFVSGIIAVGLFLAAMYWLPVVPVSQ
jgi:hypothetical protein